MMTDNQPRYLARRSAFLRWYVERFWSHVERSMVLWGESMIKIRIAEEKHISALAEIEKAAAGVFGEPDLPLHLRNETVSEQEHLCAQRQGLLLVALDDGVKPVGFAITERIDSYLHLLEIDVHPRYQRRGIGAGLLERVFVLAQDHGCEAVSLTTYKYAPWNAPWYVKQGFCICEDDMMPSHLRSILDREQEKGLDPQRRVAMRRVM